MKMKIIEVVFAAAYIISAFGCEKVYCSAVYDRVEFVVQNENRLLAIDGTQSKVLEAEDLKLLTTRNVIDRIVGEGFAADSAGSPFPESVTCTPCITMS